MNALVRNLTAAVLFSTVSSAAAYYAIQPGKSDNNRLDQMAPSVTSQPSVTRSSDPQSVNQLQQLADSNIHLWAQALDELLVLSESEVADVTLSLAKRKQALSELLANQAALGEYRVQADAIAINNRFDQDLRQLVSIAQYQRYQVFEQDRTGH